MKVAKIFAACAVSCVLTVGGVWVSPVAFANFVAAPSSGPALDTKLPANTALGNEHGSAEGKEAPLGAVINGQPHAGGKPISEPDVTAYKAGEFIDMARLVLESSRDQSATTNAIIERATTVVIVFFTLLGVGGALLGWSKLRDMEDSASNAIKQFNNDLEQMRQGASGLSAEFTQVIESSMKEMRSEMLDRIELLSASAEIAHANNASVNPQEKNQLLATASKKIELVLKQANISGEQKIRGLADLAYAKKRLGDVEKAFAAVVEAAELAKQHAVEMYPLLAYNAACYSALLQRAEACDWLEKAIREKAIYRDNACADQDFVNVREKDWFKKLTSA